jgi:predicted 3-demethylubiquinone-9 3-methyltransferase (glyoxalase superfamily)
MSNITPFLWFDHQAEEAAKFYCSVFKDSKLGKATHYSEGMPMPKGTVLTIQFELNGQSFTALNGGPMFRFNESVSFVVSCNDQAEIDYYWDKLSSSGGAPGQCGWLKDKYGLSWQVVPNSLGELLSSSDPAAAARALQALMKMQKLDLAALERAKAGE